MQKEKFYAIMKYTFMMGYNGKVFRLIYWRLKMTRRDYAKPEIEVINLLEEDVLSVSVQRSWLGSDFEYYLSTWFDEE